MTKETINPEQIRNNRLILLTIAGIPVTMVLAATWLWYYVVQNNLELGTINNGTLIQPPRQIDDWQLRGESEIEVRYADWERKWTFLVPVDGDVCGPSCESSLYLTRQIHTAMGKEFNRIDRMYISEVPVSESSLRVDQLSDDHPVPASLSQLLDTEHRGIHQVAVAPQGFNELFPEFQSDASTWYLVDPAGWVMMSYNSANSYKQVISDLKFLLKNSSE